MKHFKGFKKFIPTCTWHEGLSAENLRDPNIPQELIRELIYSQQANSKLQDGRSILFEVSSCGKNWYEARREFAADTVKVVYDPDTLRVISYDKDAMKLFPHGNNVVELESVPDDINQDTYQYNPATNKVEHSDGLALKRAKLRQTALLRDAVPHFVALSVMEDKTKAESAEYLLWRDYIRSVKRTDLSKADIVWPEKPS